MSVFDPLGLLTPFTTQSRVLMQEIWRSEIGWEDKLQDSEFKKWSEWLCELELITGCRIERCYQLRDFQIDSAELHVFCDASSKAYAAVAYWRFPQRSGTFRVSIIMAKSRVAPVKPTTIPRLELQAALLGTRIAKLIGEEHEFKITRRVFWSDSVTVLRWIKKEPRTFKIFVANRLGEISENSREEEWRWVSTAENSADDGTRLAPDALKKGSRWLLGPPFLRKVESEWPRENFINFNESSDVSELKKAAVNVNSVWAPLLDFSRFSSSNRLLTATSLICTAIGKMRKSEVARVTMYERAKVICIKQSQRLSFFREINDLENQKSISKSSQTLSLNPFLDERAILRASSRIEKFSENASWVRPIILDKNEIFTKLLIKHYHEKYYHGSNETVINEIRQFYWIIGLRQALRSLVSKCIICKMLRAQTANPKMAALPPARMAYKLRPFAHCGLDYFGPMLVKIGRRREKRWGDLFTCMTTRAIHLELAHSLSTDSVIMALKRFISRRGTPICLYSDNGTKFRGAAKELNQAIKELNKQNLEEFAARKSISWRFNPPTASHMGGTWERLIRSVKNALSVVMREQAPKEKVLMTILAEVEHSVNSRPLTHVSIDPRDQEALTPNHFLIRTSSSAIRFGNCDAQKLCTRKGWKASQSFADNFWLRWLKEYLPTLIPRKKWHENEDTLNMGDVVLILDQHLNRNQWRKGIIEKVFPGSDGEVRVAEVKTQNGNVIRPTRKLVRFVKVQNP